MIKNKPDSILKAALDAAGDIAYAWNLADDSIVWCGENSELFGESADKPESGDSFAQRIHPADIAGRLKTLSAHLNDAAPYEAEYRIRNGNGVLVWAHDRGAAEPYNGNEQPIMRGLIRVIETRKKRETRLEYLTNFDELTGHFNRARLCESLERAILIARRHKNPGSYLVMTPDNLSSPERPYDQKMRDAALVTIGQRLDRSLRASDIIGRISEDRFGVILPRCSETQAISIANKILDNVRDASVATAAGSVSLTISIGLVSFPNMAETVQDAMQKAETSLQEAQRAGGDLCISYSLTDQQQEERREAMRLAEETRNALAENRMILVFQPLLRATDGKVEFYECLLRIRESDNRLIPAADFIPVIERLGLARLIDRYVLEQVIERLQAEPELVLAMNISGMTVSNRAWLRAAVAYLKEQPDIASRIIIEITETAAIQDLEECARFVETVRGLGCRVALDDFGAGHTSFRHLKSIPADIIKIAGTYVRDLDQNPENRTFVETMIELAHGFGLQVVAEWVETQSDADLLIKMGVDLLQGNYCGSESLQPTPSAEEAATDQSASLSA